jgi:hypothetical protein
LRQFTGGNVAHRTCESGFFKTNTYLVGDEYSGEALSDRSGRRLAEDPRDDSKGRR